MENEEIKKVLWLNSNLKVAIGNPLYEFLTKVKDVAEENYKLSIQTCITGSDFVEFIKTYKWDALIIDHQGVWDDNDDWGSIGHKLIRKIDKIENQDALKYWFSIERPSESDDFDEMESHGFSKNHETGNCIFQINQDSIEQTLKVFETIKNELDDAGQLFVGYREIKMIYDSFSDKTDKKVKDSIKELLIWHKDHDHAINFENDIRVIVEKIEEKLKEIDFYKNFKGKKPSLAKYINGSHQKSESEWEDYLNTECRFKWEAVAISFLDSFQNAVHHQKTYKKPVEGIESFPIYKDYFIPMVFESFVILSKWYVRFMQKYRENNNDITMFFNDINNTNITDKHHLQ